MAASTRSSRAAFSILLGTAVIAAPLVLAPAPAHAQKKQSEKEKKKIAKGYVDAGLAAQDAGDFDRAVELYQQAYELVPHPVLLFNIAQAHRLAGRDEEALASYQQYVEVDPEGPKAKEARTFIKEIQPRVEKARAAAAVAARRAAEAEAAKAAAEEAERKRLEAEAAREVTEPEPEPEPEPVESSSGGGGRKRLGLVIGGSGLAVAATGAVFGLLASGRWSDAAAVCGDDHVCDTDADLALSRDRAAGARLFGNVSTGLLVVGGLAATAGIVLWLTAPSGVRIEPAIAEDGAGVVVRGAL